MKKKFKKDQNDTLMKKKQVVIMFNSISKKYDLLNKIITLGMDMIWRKKVINLIKKHKHDTILDIATGTGDIVVALSQLKTKQIIGLDISPKMIEIGEKKVALKGLKSQIKMQLGDCEALPFDASTFDAITIAFGVRNFENLEKSIKEIFRVLKSYGTLVILETALPQNKILKYLYLQYTQNFIPFVGKIFSKNRPAYQYLSDSAAIFTYGQAFNNILIKNGFIDVEDFPQTLGIASIYFAKKP